MGLLWDRLKVMLKSGLCRETWRLSLRQRNALTKVLLATRPATAQAGTFLCAYCPPIGSVAFRRHLDGVRRIASGQHVPLVVHLSVTDRCPCSCARCSNLSHDQPDPPLTSLGELLTRLKDAGTASIAFTGGEPLLRPDLAEMIRLCEPEMSTVLFTTGLSLDASRAMSLRQAGLSAAFVSLDHYDPSRHNQIRCHSDAFEAALRAIRLFRERGIYTAVQAVVSPDLLEGQAMERFLQFCQSLKVHEVMLLERVPVGGRTTGCRSLSDVDRQQLRALHKTAAGSASLPKINATSFLEGPDCFGCQAGFSFLYITTGGEVCPCDFVPLSFGNVYETDLQTILARLAVHFAQPRTRCLALQIEQAVGCTVHTTVPWDRVRQIMNNVPGDVRPKLMQAVFAADRTTHP